MVGYPTWFFNSGLVHNVGVTKTRRKILPQILTFKNNQSIQVGSGKTIQTVVRSAAI